MPKVTLEFFHFLFISFFGSGEPIISVDKMTSFFFFILPLLHTASVLNPKEKMVSLLALYTYIWMCIVNTLCLAYIILK